jgi:methionyl-tRNA formyltransferase
MQYCLIAGDSETGVTTMQMDAGMDTGDMLLKESIPILETDTIETLEQKLSEIGAPLLIETLDLIEKGACPREVQDNALATFCPPLAPDAGIIDWAKPAKDIVNLIRGVTPRPGAWLTLDGKKVKVWQASVTMIEEENVVPGEIVASDKNGVTVSASDGTGVILESVQPEGKPRMNATDWANGARIKVGIRV